MHLFVLQPNLDLFDAFQHHFMTAAYLAPYSPAGRQAMLGAARSFAALKQPDSAAIV